MGIEYGENTLEENEDDEDSAGSNNDNDSSNDDEFTYTGKYINQGEPFIISWAIQPT